MMWRGWYKFDHVFMKPILTNKGPPLTQSCPSWCNRLALCFTSPEAYSTGDYGNDDQEVLINIYFHYHIFYIEYHFFGAKIPLKT